MMIVSRLRFTSVLTGLAGCAWLMTATAYAQTTADGLAGQTTLGPILKAALLANPDIAEERARVKAADARARGAGRLPDTQLKYEQWGVPVSRPWAWGDANAVMVGLSQTLPAPGSRAARGRAAAQDVVSAGSRADRRRRDLQAQVRRAFADYYRADRELGLHREHVELTARLVELARASYRTGRRAQQDVLRLNLELSRLHRDLAHIEQERISARALLNALMNRPVEASLGPPAEITPASEPAGAAERAASARPEITAARAAVARSQAELEVSRSEARWPSVTLGADYMYMPSMQHRHGWGAMVMLNLPWLSSARHDAIDAAEQIVAADQQALVSVETVARYEARDARARFDAARSTFDILDRDLVPLARRNFETAEAGYGAGQGDAISLLDALRSFLDTRLDRVRSLVHLENVAADLERLTGEGGSR